MKGSKLSTVFFLCFPVNASHSFPLYNLLTKTFSISNFLYIIELLSLIESVRFVFESQESCHLFYLDKLLSWPHLFTYVFIGFRFCSNCHLRIRYRPFGRPSLHLSDPFLFFVHRLIWSSFLFAYVLLPVRTAVCVSSTFLLLVCKLRFVLLI